MIKAIYFDIGGVVVTDGFFRAAPLFLKELKSEKKLTLEQKSNLSEQKIFDAYVKTDDYLYPAGKIGMQRWIYFFRELGIGEKDIDILHYLNLWHSTFVPIKETIKIILEMKKHYIVGCLSDQPKDILPYFENLGILDFFDPKIISCEVGHSKDEKNLEIYKIAIKQAKVKPYEILFIDNNEKNLNNASKLGMNTLHFVSAAQLKVEFPTLIQACIYVA